MTRRCVCREPLSESEITAAYSIGVRIEHDAEPCLLPPTPGTNAEPCRVKAVGTVYNDPRPVLTRLPQRLSVEGRR
jgi:hypothetical protein